MARWKLCACTTFEISHFPSVHCHSKNPTSPKVFHRFSKSLPQLEDFEGGHMGGKFQARSHFTFAMASWNRCVSTTLGILPLSSCTLCLKKSYISKGIQPIFEILASARRCWRWAFGCKFQVRRYFTFATGRWKHCASQYLKFCHFQLYTVAAKLLILQCYSNDFRNLRLSWTILRVGIWVESFRRAGILLLQWQGEIVAHRQHLKFCDFQPVHCASKNPISSQVFNRFSKCLAQLEDFEGGHLGRTFQARRYVTFATGRWKHCASQYLKFCHFQLYTVAAKLLIFQCYSNDFPNLRLSWTMLRVGIWVESFRRAGILLLQWQGEIVAHRQHLKFCDFQPVHCACKNPISPKVFNPFSKSLPQLEDVEGGHLGGKSPARRYFTFVMARWKLCASTTFEISHFQPVHCACKNPISPKVFNRFSKSLPQLENFEGGHLGGKFEGRRYFTFAMAKWKLCASTTFEVLPLSTCTLCQQKSYIPKGIQPIFEIFGSARRCWGRAFGWKVSGAQVFYFCNGKVKTLRIYNIWNFPLSTCTLCLQKSYISKGIQPIFEIFAPAGKLWGWAFGWKVWRAQVFYFCNGKVKTLRIDNIWSFATFNLYTVPAKILYPERYSTDFRNLWLSSKMLREGIWEESFRCADILLLQ